jgi:ABC-2 type transport system permease protein
MRRILTLSKLIMVINLRNGTTMFWNFAFPLGLLAIYGFIFGDQAGSAPGTMIAWLAVGVVALNMMSGGLVGDSAWLTSMREQGLLQRVRATPLSPLALVTAYLLVRLSLIIAQSAAILALAVLAFDATFTWSGLAGAFGAGLLGAAVFIALGQAIAALAPSAGAALAIAQSLSFPLMFISNLFLPATQLPTWLQALSRWTPAYALVDIVRPQLVPIPATQAFWLNLALLVTYGLAALAVAACCFRWEPRR